MFYHLKDATLPEISLPKLFLSNAAAKFGVIKQMRYTSDAVNKRIQTHPENFLFAKNNRALIQLLVDKKIEGFFADKMQMELLLWRSGLHTQVTYSDIEMGNEPVHFLMSKKTISPEFVTWFNDSLNKFKLTADYNNIL